MGQILDFLGFTIKMLFVEKSTTTTDLLLLNDIFQIMPTAWESDPVKVSHYFITYAHVTHDTRTSLHCVPFNYNPFCPTISQVHLITKIIYETLSADFNNTMHVITKIICVNNKLGFYVGLTLFWALYLNYFKKDSHHYYKMYNVDKFFKLLLSSEPFNGNEDADSMFKLLLLISIYQNYVILNKDSPEDHQVFQEFFRVSPNASSEREKLKNWLINVKALIEVNNPLTKPNQSSDVLMVSAKKKIRRVHKRVKHHFSRVTQLEGTNASRGVGE